jgi:hypothetical protein
LMLLGTGATELSLKDRGDADIGAWLGTLLSAKGLDPLALDKPLPYDMPVSAIGSIGRYRLDHLDQALGELAEWYDNASRALDDVRQGIVARGLRAPPVRCWPHHFDLDTLIYFDAQNTRSMGVGFSPGDHYYGEPYFYVSIYPAPAAALPALPLGHWHSHDFTAAVTPAECILHESDQGAAVDSFLRSATDIIIRKQSTQPAE